MIDLIRTINAKVKLFIGYKSVTLTLSLPNGIQQAYIFEPIEEPNTKFRNHACHSSQLKERTDKLIYTNCLAARRSTLVHLHWNNLTYLRYLYDLLFFFTIV